MIPPISIAPFQHRWTFVFVLSVLTLFTPLWAQSIAAQAICENCGYTYQTPVSEPGGPYVGIRGENLQFNGGGSWSSAGSVTDYQWDFGDGPWGFGSSPTHQYSADGVYTVTLWVGDDMGNWSSTQCFVTVDSVSLPIRLNFEDLPNNTIVTDQYLNSYGVKFHSNSFVYPVHIYQNCGFCSTTSPPNYINTKPDDYGQLIVEFTQPVSNLSFAMIGLDTLTGPFGRLDVYRDGSLSTTYVLNGVFNSTVPFSLGNTTNISKIVVYGLTDPAGIGFDDFTFTLPAEVRITSPRVSGRLNDTTQNALAGADILLTSSLVPGGFSGGSYSWSFTGPVQLVSGATNSTAVTIRSTAVGTITANLVYTKNGIPPASARVTINAVLPTLSNFSATQGRDLIIPPGGCGSPDQLVRYRLGCTSASPFPDNGVQFTASIMGPTTYLSEPAQSGTKYVQAASAFRKQVRDGFLECTSKRTTPADISSGWQLDNRDPYNGDASDPIPRFSQGNSLIMRTVDFPANALTPLVFEREFIDAIYIDDSFEMYVYYFAGADPGAPQFQALLGKVSWNWGGQVVYRTPPNLGPNHYIDFSNVAPTTRAGVPASSTVGYQGQGRVQDLPKSPCPNGPPLSTSLIDGSRKFVRQQYVDFLNRQPDQGGLNYWTSQISYCAFDFNCINARRLSVSLAFFYAPEFIGNDPQMANPPGTPGFNPAVYNPRFVYYCYSGYLDREPEAQGWEFWTNVLNQTGDYIGMINQFITSPEYRNVRFPRP